MQEFWFDSEGTHLRSLKHYNLENVSFFDYTLIEYNRILRLILIIHSWWSNDNVVEQEIDSLIEKPVWTVRS